MPKKPTLKSKKPTLKSQSGTAKKVTAKDDVLPWATKRKTFTTGQVSDQFGVSPGQAAALVAILRIKEAIEPHGNGPDGTSAWAIA